MYQQLDLFSIFTEQVGSIAMKEAEQGIVPEEKAVPEPEKETIPKEQLDTILKAGAAGITAASASMPSTSRARHRRKWRNF